MTSPDQQRDVVFIFGAGASAPDGVPLQRDLLPYIAASKDERLSNSWMGSGLRDFLEAWFYGELSQGTYPSLEEVFGFIDFHRITGESLGEEWSVDRLDGIRGALIACIHHAVHVGSQGKPGTYGVFWNRVGSLNPNIGVVSLNYDPLLENAFDPLFPNTALIDFGCHLMNYGDPPRLPAHWWWTEPSCKTPASEGSPASIKLLKIHVSLNWRYCTTCRGVLLTPWESSIDLDNGIFHWKTGPSCFEPEVQHELVCPYDGTHFETLIAPPSHSKRFDHPVLSVVVSEAIRELRRARRVVVVGYSFPEADVYLRSLLTRAVSCPEVLVVDPGLSAPARARFRSVFGDLEFVEMGFEDFVASGRLDVVLRSAPTSQGL